MRRLIALGAASFALLAPATAAADCPQGWTCGEVTVPISGADPGLGTATVGYAKRAHDDQDKPAEGTTLATDAPGGASFPAAEFLAFSALGDLTATHDIVVVEPRGTGAHALDCPAYQHGTAPFAQAIPACAAQLGAARDYSTYGDLADDLDAVRSALELDTVDLYATGHATPVLEAYAVRHAEHVHSLVIDSAMSLPPWADEDLDNALRVAALVCKRSPLCSAEIRDPAADLAWLARRLRERPLTGTGFDGDGYPVRVRLDEAELAFKLLLDKRGRARTPAELPAAARALRDGDPVPLLRLAAENDGPFGWAEQDSGDPAEYSNASLNAAFCSEWPFGWDKAAPLGPRLAQFQAARAGLPRDFFAPFSLAAGLAPTPDQCLYWPPPQRTNPILPPGERYPDVPVLVIHGDLNTDHPLLHGARVAARFPRGRFVAIEQAGQSAAGWSSCARRIIRTFVTTLDAGDTSCAPEAVPGVGAFPRSVRDYAPALPDPAGHDRSTRRDRQLAAVAVHTALDAVYTQFNHGSGTGGRGLRGGEYSVEFGDTGAAFSLRAARLVEDVEVSGTFFFGFTVANDVQLSVKSRGVAGTLETTDSVFDPAMSRMRVRGRIGGRRVALLVPIH